MSAHFRIRREQGIALLLLAAGAALRLLWLALAVGPISGPVGSAEASRVAVAFASGRGISDAYYQGYGPTAHLMPVSPAIAGSLLWLFGIHAAAANVALLAWCLIQVGAAYLLWTGLFATMGVERRTPLLGLALLCLLAPFAPQEVIDFRYWEGASALALVAANLLLIAKLGDTSKLNRFQVAAIAVLSASTLFVSPPAGVAVGACWTVWALRQLSVRRCAQLAAASAGAVALLLGPWALRNQRELGTPVLLRSNFGLELALANHAGAVSDQPPGEIFAARLRQIHPTQASGTRPLRVPPGQEVAYSRKLARESFAWIETNPWQFGRLWCRHLSGLLFPQPWQMEFSGWGGLAAARALAISAVNLLGLIGLFLGLRGRRRGFGMLAIYVAALALPYALFQPTARYIYLIYVPLAFPAAEVAIRAWRALLARSRGSPLAAVSA